jgi:hypothetical protein
MIFILAAAPFALIGLALLLFTIRSLRSPRGLAVPPRTPEGRPRPPRVVALSPRWPLERTARGRSPATLERPDPPGPAGSAAPALERGAMLISAAARSRVIPGVASLPAVMGPLAERVRVTAARTSQSWPRLDPQVAPGPPPGAAVGLVIVVLGFLAALALFLTRDRSAPDAGLASQTGPTPAAAAESVAPSATSVPPPAAAFNDEGDPYSGTEIRNAWSARGLTATVTNEPVPCTNPAVPPRAYSITRANGAAGDQRVVLMVYPTGQAMEDQWTTGSGGARFRNGSCGIGASVVYWNRNAILMIFPITDAALRQSVTDAFLAATP